MNGRMQAAWVAARNVLLGGNLASLSLATSPRRLVHLASENLFLYRNLAERRLLPAREVWSAWPDADPVADVRLAHVRTGAWPVSSPAYVADIVNLCVLCALVQPKRIFEIGTLHGYSALHFALNSPDARVFTLDLPRDPAARATSLRTTAMDDAHITGAATVEHCWAGYAEAQRIEPLYGDSATFDYSPYHDSIDLFFVDGAHSYEYVRSDTEHALRCVRRGGVIAWHDYGRMGVNGVSRWLHEFRAAGNDVFAPAGGSLAVMRVG